MAEKYTRNRILRNPVRMKQVEARKNRPKQGAKLFWTKERNKELRKLWSLGRPAETIGEVIGVTASAVFHQAEKLKLKRRDRTYRSRESCKERILKTAEMNGYWVQPPSWKNTMTEFLIKELISEGKLLAKETTRDGCVHLIPKGKQ